MSDRDQLTKDVAEIKGQLTTLLTFYGEDRKRLSAVERKVWALPAVSAFIAIVPAVICTAFYGESGTARLLVLSQVILSMQLSFAVIPLVLFTGNRGKMGEFVNPLWVKILAWLTAGIIVLLNVKYLYDKVLEWLR